MRFMNVSRTEMAAASGLVAAWLALSIVAVTAQETNELVRIDFRNKISGVVDAPVYHFDGVTLLESTSFGAVLHVGLAETALVPAGFFYSFLTGTNAGYWDFQAPLETVVPSPLPSLGQRIWFQVAIYEFVPDSPFWKPVYAGSSRIYSMVITNHVMPMVGLESFKLEPERLEISTQVDQTIVQWQYLAASRYELRSTSDLKPPVSWALIFEWSGIGENWQIFSVTNTITAIPQFYRLERWSQPRD